MLEIAFSNLRAKNPDYDKDKEREREEEEKERKKAEKKAKKKAKDKEKKKRKKKNKDPDYYGTPQYDAADDPLLSQTCHQNTLRCFFIWYYFLFGVDFFIVLLLSILVVNTW